jgi:pilus assembly protein CpaF
LDFAALAIAAVGGLMFLIAIVVIAVTGVLRRPQAPAEFAGEDGEVAVDPNAQYQSMSADNPQWSFGFGPLRGLMQDETVTEVMVNGYDRIFVERNGRIELTNIRFSDDKHVVETIRRIIVGARRRIDDSSPMVDARLADGSRVNAVLAPLSTQGPCLTIRKFTRDLLSLDDLMDLGTLDAGMADFLYQAVAERKNICVSGGSGSGKTTLLNVLASLVPEDERVITIEDAAELRLVQPNVISLESRPPNMEGQGEIDIRRLVVNALRMRPDRIIVGEVRGSETLDMLQAMNTGHDGCLTSLHANSTRDAVARLETLTLMAGMDLPSSAVRQQIVAAIDMIIQTSRMADGSRKIVEIADVSGIENGDIVLRDIFRYRSDGADGQGVIQGAFLPVNPGPAQFMATPVISPARASRPPAAVSPRKP